jgi:predicted porin
MKRTLFATTALATAGLLAASAGDAFGQAAAPAAEKLKLSLGGFMFQTIGYATQDGDWERANAGDYKAFDTKADSEIYFSGSVKLDNGLTVGVRAEIEADSSTGGASGTTWDATYMTIASPTLGTVTVGSTDAPSFYLGVQAPWAGLNFYDGTLASWIVAPSDGAGNGSTTYSGAFDFQRVAYMSPTFAGFRVGGSYAPSTTHTQTQPINTAGTDPDHWDIGTQYAGKFGDVGVRASATYWRIDGSQTAVTDNWQVGADVTFADFTVGGAYGETSGDRALPGTVTQPDQDNWNVGIKYAPGPYQVALTYGRSTGQNAAADPDDDTHTRYQLGAGYTMGPGVTLLGSLSYQKYEAETNAAVDENNGWAIVGGINVDF